MISQMFAQIGSNDLGAFKAHLEENMEQVAPAINDIKYSYGVKPLIFREDTEKDILQVNPGTLFSQITGSSAMSAYMDTDVFQEMIGNIDMLDSQYDVLRGRWPEAYNEMIVVLQDPHQISDYMAYTLGIKDPKELNNMIQQVMQGKEPENPAEPSRWTYDDLMALRFRLVPASQKYRYNEEYNVWEDMSQDQDHMRRLIAEGEELTIVGIVCPKEGVSSTTLAVGIGYTSALTQYVIDEAAQSEIVAGQLADMNIDVFTGKGFGETEDEEEDSGLSFEDMISVDEELISSAFGTNMNQYTITAMLESYMKEITGSLTEDNGPAQAAFSGGLGDLATDMLQSYIAANATGENGGAVIRLSDVEGIVDNYLAGSKAEEVIAPMAAAYQLPASSFTQVYHPLLVGMLTAYIARDVAENYVPDTVTVTGELDALPVTGEEGTAETPEEDTEGDRVPSEEGEVTPPEPTEDAEAEPDQPTEDTEGENDQPTEGTEPETPEISIDPSQFSATITADDVPGIVSEYLSNPVVTGASSVMATRMTEATVREKVMQKLSGFGNRVMAYIGSSFYVDEEKLASAFQFEMDEEELRRLMEAMANPAQEASAQSNLRSLGYADTAQPTAISVYLVDFAGKEKFLEFLDGYNADMETAEQEDQVIRYTDITGIMMSSVKTIIDSVSYALIAFVAVSLIVSSIMIGIITYISVMERTKEIGVLRAIGASKRNISQVFNAETFIIGLCSGLIGVGLTIILNIPINEVIHALTNNLDIVAQLPVVNGLVLIGLSVLLTLIGGFIPSKQAAKKDPVIALRSE